MIFPKPSTLILRMLFLWSSIRVHARSIARSLVDRRCCVGGDGINCMMSLVMAASLGAPHLHTLSGFSLRRLPRSLFPLQPHDYRRFLNTFCPLLQSSDASSSAFVCCWLHIASSCCCFCFRHAYLAVGRSWSSRFRGSGIYQTLARMWDASRDACGRERVYLRLGSFAA
jgi:hypothetical protein